MLIFVCVFFVVVLLSFLYAGMTKYSYKIKCPRCTGEAVVTVSGSADQYESTSCSCGYKKEEVL